MLTDKVERGGYLAQLSTYTDRYVLLVLYCTCGVGWRWRPPLRPL